VNLRRAAALTRSAGLVLSRFVVIDGLPFTSLFRDPKECYR